MPTHGLVDLVVDSTGLSVFGEGEWAAAKHGGRGKRGWKKLHLGVDRSGVIVAQALTAPTSDDPTTGGRFVETVPGDVASVTADTAYDTVAFYAAASARDARIVVPPARTASLSRHGPRPTASVGEGSPLRKAPPERSILQQRHLPPPPAASSSFVSCSKP